MVPSVQQSLKKVARGPYWRAVGLAKERDLTWRYTFNLHRTVPYKLRREAKSPGVEPVLRVLERDGVVMTSVDELLKTTSRFDELREWVARFDDEQRDVLDEARNAARLDGGTLEKRDLFGYAGKFVSYDTRRKACDTRSDVFAAFALQEPIVEIVNAYFGMYTRLRYYDVWRNFPTLRASASQMWHRDPADRCVVKVFVNLSDVGQENGPFCYAPGTHYKGVPLRRSKPDMFMGRRGMGPDRRQDHEIEGLVPSSRWIRALGPAGTITIADTGGYHKGELRNDERVMYMCMFTSSLG